MAEPSKDTDQSMEDILQSIKRIIADEGEPEPTVAGSDVLELTELLAEDVAIAPAQEKVADIAADAAMGFVPLDEIMDDTTTLFQATVSDIVAAPKPMVNTPEPIAQPQPELATPSSAPAEKLLSDASFAAAASALGALTNASSGSPTLTMGTSPAFRSGTTVEDLVMEALRPMLKEWLDANLPPMVRSLVEKEIRRLSAH